MRRCLRRSVYFRRYFRYRYMPIAMPLIFSAMRQRYDVVNMLLAADYFDCRFSPFSASFVTLMRHFALSQLMLPPPFSLFSLSISRHVVAASHFLIARADGSFLHDAHAVNMFA